MRFLYSRRKLGTMCRMMANVKRILRPLRKGPTQRNLFGPIDREQLRADYQAALRKDLEEASRRWGFDFMSDRPLANGDFQWEGVPGAEVPLVYRSRMLGKAAGPRATEATVGPKRAKAEPPECEKENIPENKSDRCPFNGERTPRKKENAGLKRKQTNITDFYQSKRRFVGMPLKSGE
ncbi:cyclin-dependent kinase inhibitor 1 isoform X1 [Phyllopteryx taeniolatus]|uniref:cyclin-dependent kinase inhibitor 1 isoform X1 n=2 Tax=Phyllopteryx taeniolatus TaxID=161469 RepID=UPI002AD22209|nr:cyclin-dependent kinase inhibitor 1 isoform X1 [Phyllopteryx taeniolatus]